MKTISLSRDQVYSGSLILVNPAYGVAPSFAPALYPVYEKEPSVLLDRQAAALLNGLMSALGGWAQIAPVSGWRALKEQQRIWDGTLAESGEAFTQKYVALPGHSEHQTGLAIDLGLRQAHIDFICPNFPYEGICQMFRNHAPEYGFVERYPAGKERVTGIGHEMWHFRYVGVPHARIMTEGGLVLEEYIDFLRRYPWGERHFCHAQDGQNVEIAFKKAEEGETLIELDEACHYSISGNNVDGFIVTLWRRNNGGETEIRRA